MNTEVIVENPQTTQSPKTKNLKLILASVLVIGIVLVIILVVLLTKNTNTTENPNRNTNNQSQNNEQGRNARPVLQNLSINFGKYDEMTGRAGAFVFDINALKGNSQIVKPLLEFGFEVTSDGVTKVLPEIAYTQVDSDTDVLAMAGGKVVEVRNQGKDYSVGVVFGDNWAVLYDHISNPQVSVNDMIEAGDIIGKVALNRDGVTGFTEIAVKYVTKDNVSEYYCPLDLLSAEVKQKYINDIQTLMDDWKEYSGDETSYVDADQVTPGCVMSTHLE